MRAPTTSRRRRALLAVAGVGLVGVALVALAGAWLGTGGGSRWLAGRLEGAVEGASAGATCRIENLDPGVFRWTVSGVTLDDAGGQRLLTLDRAELRVDPWALLGGALHVPAAKVTGVHVDARRRLDGTWDWAAAFPPSGSDAPTALPLDVRIDDLAVADVDVRALSPEGTVADLADGWLTARFVGHSTTFDLSELTLGADLVTPGPLAVGAWGGVQWDSVRGAWLRELELVVGGSSVFVDGLAGERTGLAVAVDRLEGADVGALLGRPLAGVWHGSGTVTGPPGDLRVVASLGGEGGDGALALVGDVDATAPTPRWSAVGEAWALHVERVDPSVARPVVVSGVVALEGAGVAPTRADVAGRWAGGAQVLYGQPVDRVDAAFALRGGTLALAPSRIDGVLGAMTLQGSYDLVRGGLDLTIASDLSPARLAALGTPGLDGAGRVVAAVTRAPGGSAVRVAGTARWAPFVYGPDVRAGALSVPFDVAVESGEVRGTFDLAGRAVTAYGATAAGLSGRRLALSRRADGRLDVAGTVDTPAVAYGTRFVADRASTALRVRMAGGHRDVSATTTVGPHAILGLPAGGGVVFTTLLDDRVRAEVHLGSGARATLDTVARFDLASGALSLDTLTFAPTARATWTAPRPVTMVVVDGGAADLDLAVRSPLGVVEVRGDLATSGPVDATIAVGGFELDHLTELWPDLGDLGGRLDLRASIAGTAEAPAVDAEVAVDELFAFGNARWLDVDGRVTLADGVLRPALALGAVGAPLGHLSGAVPVTGGLAAPAVDLDAPAALRLALVPGPVARLATVLPALDGTTIPVGALSAAIDATGPLRDPDVRVAGVAEVEAPGFRRPARTELDLRRSGAGLTFGADVREDLALRAVVTGEGATRAGEVLAGVWGAPTSPDVSLPETWLSDMLVRVVLASVPVEGLGALAGAPTLGGELLGGVVVTGDPRRPVVEGGVNWVDASIAGQPFDGAYLAVLPGPEGYHLDAVATLPEGGGIEVHGAVPVAVDLLAEPATWARGDLDLAVSGPGVPVTLLSGLDPAVRGLSGRIAVSGTVGGRPDAPRPDLEFTGRRLGAVVRPLGVATDGARLDAHLTADALTFDAKVPTAPARTVASLDLEPGAEPRIRAQGSVALADWTPGALDVTVHLADGAWIAATDATKIRTSGALRIDGDASAPRVRGDLRLVQGRVEYETAGPGDAAPLALDPSLGVVRPSVAPPAPPPPPAPHLALDVGVDVDLGRNLQFELSMPFVEQLGELGAQVSRVDLSTRVGGRVRVRAQDGAPTLVGELELVDGTVRLMRSTFDLQEGRVTFAGGDPYEDAELDVSARMQVASAALDLRIAGTPVEPTFSLASAEYPDPTEQMVILLTGSAPDELSADQGAGAALALLWSSAFAGMRLGSFSVEPSGAVRLGMPVSRRLYTSTTWALSQDPTVNQLTLEADWSLSRHVVLVGALGDRQSWGDLYWEIKF